MYYMDIKIIIEVKILTRFDKTTDFVLNTVGAYKRRAYIIQCEKCTAAIKKRI